VTFAHTRRWAWAPVAAVLALGAAACGDTTPDDTASLATERSAADLTLVAEDVAFVTTELQAAAGSPVTITLDNRDDGVPHNLHVEGADGGDVATEVESGPVTQELEVSFSTAGEYTYVCDVHPDTMRGTITVTS
jgi:plastocyanin